ncbi:MAG: pyridoxal phosphate-dependent aminotransferase [Candidatus Schekmanbacteria bacterium]|nr:MAG: pyridoxal phosphate-dependent aminotransferase [Candidatus Schekmanbacteria bacterium]
MELSERAKALKPSPTLSITALANKLKAEGKDVIGFGAGQPDFDTPDNIKEAAKRAIDNGFTKYTPSAGINELKDAIIEKFKSENGLEYKRSEIVVSSGAKDFLFNLAMVLLNPGDEVIIPSPYWVSYPDQVEIAGGKPVIVETKEEDGFCLKADALREKITERTKALILNSPSNPTGGAYEVKDLEEIAEVVLEKGILVISDEIYERLVYDGYKHTSIASLSNEMKKNTIVVNGVSKTYSMTGWRIGYGAGNEEIMSAITKLQSQSISNPVSISQMASIEAITGDQSAVEKMRLAFDERRKFVVSKLNSIEGVKCFNPKGAFYCFPNFSGIYGKSFEGKAINSSNDLTETLLSSFNVAAVPGAAFGSDNNIRISYATGMEMLEKGLKRIEDFVSALK